MAGEDPTATSGTERRRHERVATDLRVRVDVGGATVEGRTVNVSEGGVAMDLPEAPLSAKGLLIAIELAELGWQELRGELRRSEPNEGGGVRLAARFAAAATEGGPEAIREFIDRYFEGASDRV
jgi:hypothetical protein